MKVLVIGGSGFLGSHVADALEMAGHTVAIFDESEPVFKTPTQVFMRGSILDRASLENATRGLDAVYHFAGLADIDECSRRPTDAVELNIKGTNNVLEVCIKNGVKRIVFSSSAYVYSNKGSVYRVTKQCAENLISTYSELYGIEFVVLRYGTLYGTRSDRRNNIFRIVEDAITQRKITYKGDGKERRELIHVKDAAALSAKMMETEFKNQYFLITGPTLLSYSEILETIDEILGGNIEINYDKQSASNHYRHTPYSFNPTVAKKLLANPHIDLGQGLMELIEAGFKRIQE